MKNKEDRFIGLVNEINSLEKGMAKLGDELDNPERIPSGIMPLDFALGGGFPRGRITDIFGMESVGKSTLCYVLIAQAQKMGIDCAIIDAENAYMPSYVERFGVNIKRLIVVAPATFESGAEAIEKMVRGGVGLIVVDSIAAMVPRSEGEAAAGKSPMAIQARLMSQMMRKLVTPIKKHNTTLVCINQLRANLLATNPYDRYTSTGGFALKFYSSVRIKVSKVGAILSKKEHVGNQIEFKVVKNKVGRPNGKCSVPYFFESGYARDGDLVQIGLDSGVLTRDGNSIMFNGTKIGRGKEDASSTVEASSELREQIISLVFPQSQQSEIQPSEE